MLTFPAPSEVDRLVRQFEKQRSHYTSAQYNETQLRREFVDPFFAALGWDMDNTHGVLDAFKDVIHEDSLVVEGRVKAPDYGFRAGGDRKFFVETKRPAVNLQVSADSAYQLRRYAWSAKLPLSILTTFDALSIYDTRVRPQIADGAAVARIAYFTVDEYQRRWSELSSLFGRDAVYSGSIDRFAAESRRLKGTLEVDDAFLAEIESWREQLANNLALRNELTQPELNYAVQAIIDRIIFLRICEDRGIEDTERLKMLGDGTNLYTALCAVFRDADAKYNSGLFHFAADRQRAEQPDVLTPTLIVDDAVLKRIIHSLYYPSPYDFRVFPADVLGQVYERFLGNVIRITQSGRQAVVERKPEVREAKGVYYTPTHIVRYIIQNTLGEVLANKTPNEARGLTAAGSRSRTLHPVRVLDPACGSGSFLLGAYQFLLRWFLCKYAEDAERWSRGRHPVIYLAPGKRQGTAPGYRLTIPERKRILTEHIFGVDIDSQAVEVTKLSLLLQVLEGESATSVGQTRALFHERALPDLGSNVQCGNSLIGTDYFDEPYGLAIDAEGRQLLKAFDWNDAFPDVARVGGFDAVVGNPPYVFGEFHDTAGKPYYATRFGVAHDQYDTYWLFVESAAKRVRDGGRFGLIVPDALLARDVAAPVRKLLLSRGLRSLYHCGMVFNASVSAVVFIAEPGAMPERIQVLVRDIETPVERESCSRQRFDQGAAHRFLIHATDAENELLMRLMTQRTLGDVAAVSRGEELGKRNVLERGPIPILVGEDIGRYSICPPSRFVRAINKNRELYRSPKIVLVKTGAACIASLDAHSLVTMQSVYNLHMRDDVFPIEALLGILNSRFARWFIDRTFTAYKLLFPQMNQTTVESIPVPRETTNDVLVLAGLVTRMLTLQVELEGVRTPSERAVIERQIAACERKIDAAVNRSLGLSDAEMALVQAATQEGR
ncbi:MAG: N-6 DNA methylase [Phycisphaeraceae bacterium]|nr:N-6 DNA methylase [Phycisphaeraceae bacterium]MBX3367598.1 N-6 DNA methylase [Phycisphaeraceae bacterium]